MNPLDDHQQSGGEKLRAVVLLSGGLDSATVLALAQRDGFEAYALSFRYGQRHAWELEAARRVAERAGVTRHVVAEFDLRTFGSSALTDDIEVPKNRSSEEMSEGIPVTYVPARNTIFLSFALGWAEMLEAADIFVGVNALDYGGYPDCRPEYVRALEALANLATKTGVEGRARHRIHTPLIEMSKADIIRIGLDLGADYGLISSCYDPSAGGECDACVLRLQGFTANCVPDPARYRSTPANAAKSKS